MLLFQLFCLGETFKGMLMIILFLPKIGLGVERYSPHNIFLCAPVRKHLYLVLDFVYDILSLIDMIWNECMGTFADLLDGLFIFIE